jgi:TIR domain
MPKIAISYRRSDSASMSGRIFDRLATYYGDDALFMDIDDIPFGIDFRSHFCQMLERSDVLIAVIGDNWLGRNGAGAVRMQEETDPVRVEIETALERQIPIIPVLIDGARMPGSGELPASFGNFAYLNAAEVSSGRDFRVQMERLVAAIDRIVTPGGCPNASAVQTRRGRLEGPQAVRGSNSPFTQISHVEVVQYLVIPLVVLLVFHYVVVNSLNLNTNYLRLACVLVPLASGFALFWSGCRGAGLPVVFALALGLIGDIAMTILEGLYSGDPILPQTRFEWLNNLQFTGRRLSDLRIHYATVSCEADSDLPPRRNRNDRLAGTPQPGSSTTDHKDELKSLIELGKAT